ncbi:MAG: T9SS C-terminal target domain-containing protein [Chitinophagia bacterium]|nr:T9SS C-terminal target domain-containing protein [Chitinophagia bacterium]
MGVSTSQTIALSAAVNTPGDYDVAIYDIMGRKVYNDMLFLREEFENHTFNNLNLTAGVYMVKISGRGSYGLVRTVIQ